MNIHKPKLIFVTVAIIGFITLVSLYLYQYPIRYSSESIHGIVIDKDTGDPIAGVVVLAYWLLQGGLEGDENLGVINVLETVTDSEGRYYFEEWGPVRIPYLFSNNARLKRASPGLIFFKEGYGYETRLNPLNIEEESKSFKSSVWTGTPIGLEALDVQSKEYTNKIEYMVSHIERIVFHENSSHWCRSFPKMISEISSLSYDLGGHYSRLSLSLVEDCKPLNRTTGDIDERK